MSAPLGYPPQRPLAVSTVSSLPLPIIFLPSPKSPPSLASPSSSASVFASRPRMYPLCSCQCAAHLCPGHNRDCLSSFQILPPPPSFLSLVMVSVTCVHFVPEDTDRMVQEKKSSWKTLVPRTIDAELLREVEGSVLLLVLVRMYPLRTGEFKNYKFS